jgi:arginine decarboxylase
MLVDKLREAQMLDCLELVHFHIGSQISAVRAIKDAMKGGVPDLRRAGQGGSRAQVHRRRRRPRRRLRRLVHQLALVDQLHHAEYATTWWRPSRTPAEARVQAHPDIITVVGRALVAHHSVLVFNILDVNEVCRPGARPRDSTSPGDPAAVETWRSVLAQRTSRRPTTTRCSSRRRRPQSSTSACSTARPRPRRADLLGLLRGDPQDHPRDGLRARRSRGLEKGLADTYYGNFSVFQSAPDHWAVKQLFPILPLHRLNERPTRAA